MGGGGVVRVQDRGILGVIRVYGHLKPLSFWGSGFHGVNKSMGFTSTAQVPFNRALMVLNSGHLGYNRG